MSAKANYFKIGVFVLSSTALALVGIVVLGAGTLFKRSIMMETYLDESVQGLDVGAPIKFRGVKIGTVKHIDFVGHRYRSEVPEDQLSRYANYVVIIGAIRQIRDELTEEQLAAARKKQYAAGLRVRLASHGITGVVYLEADYLDPLEYPPLEIPWETKAIYVPSAPSITTVVGHALGNIARDLSQANVHQVVKHLDGLVLAMTKLIGEVNPVEFSGRARQVLAELQGTLQDTRRLVNGAEVKKILSDAAVTGGEVRQFLADLSPASKQIRTAAESLPTTMARLDKSLRRVDVLLSNKSQDVEEIVENLRVVSENLRELTKNAKRYPSYVLFGEPPAHVNSAK
ncbi:MAG: MlaD family protein [Nitrospiraceae bacterium]